MQIIHLINHSKISLGGAQKILHALFEAAPEKSSIISFDILTSAKKTEKSSKTKALLLIAKELINKNEKIFVIHHRLFIPLFLLFPRKKAIFICHNIFPSKNFIFRLAEKLRIIAVSDEVSEYIKRINKKANITVIPNGINPAPNELNTIQGNEEFVIGFIGRLDYQKGIDILFDAIGILKKENSIPNMRLHIVGDGELKGSLIEKAKALGMDDRIIFHGYSRTPFINIQNANALIVPSRYEGFGLVFYEALERGHFVIASKIPTFKSFPNDQRVLYFEPGSPRALKNSIEQAFKQKPQLAKDTQPQKRHPFPTEQEMIKKYLSEFSKNHNE